MSSFFHFESMTKVRYFTYSEWTGWSGQLVDVFCHWVVLVIMALWEDKKGEESDRSQKGDLSSQSRLSRLPVCRRSSTSSPPFNVSPTSSSLQSVMFLYSCDSKTSQLYFQAHSESHIEEDTDSLFTCLLRCGDVSLLDWRSWSMSWPISLKVGLSVGSRLQQRVISSYLGRQGLLKVQEPFCFISVYYYFEEQEKVDNRSHLGWGKVWPCHVEAILDHLVELSVHGNVWVRTFTLTGVNTQSAVKTTKIPIATVNHVLFPTHGKDLP